jgi:hypothetical protein
VRSPDGQQLLAAAGLGVAVTGAFHQRQGGQFAHQAGDGLLVQAQHLGDLAAGGLAALPHDGQRLLQAAGAACRLPPVRPPAHLMAPAVRPLMMYCWKTTYTASAGTALSSSPANW